MTLERRQNFSIDQMVRELVDSMDAVQAEMAARYSNLLTLLQNREFKPEKFAKVSSKLWQEYANKHGVVQAKVFAHYKDSGIHVLGRGLSLAVPAAKIEAKDSYASGIGLTCVTACIYHPNIGWSAIHEDTNDVDVVHAWLLDKAQAKDFDSLLLLGRTGFGEFPFLPPVAKVQQVVDRITRTAFENFSKLGADSSKLGGENIIILFGGLAVFPSETVSVVKNSLSEVVEQNTPNWLKQLGRSLMLPISIHADFLGTKMEIVLRGGRMGYQSR